VATKQPFQGTDRATLLSVLDGIEREVTRIVEEQRAVLEQTDKLLAAAEQVIARARPSVARALESLRACLQDERSDKDVSACATRLLHAARGPTAKTQHANRTASTTLEKIRDVIAEHVASRGQIDPGYLATFVQVVAESLGPEVLRTRAEPVGLSEYLTGRPPAGPIDRDRWRKAITFALDDLEDRPGVSARDVAEAVLRACAKASGIRRPSAMFDRERKARARTARKRQRSPADTP
jgi:hypothetical protein